MRRYATTTHGARSKLPKLDDIVTSVVATIVVSSDERSRAADRLTHFSYMRESSGFGITYQKTMAFSFQPVISARATMIVLSSRMTSFPMVASLSDPLSSEPSSAFRIFSISSTAAMIRYAMARKLLPQGSTHLKNVDFAKFKV